MFAHVESEFNHFRNITHDHLSRLAAMFAVDKEVDATKQHLRSLLTRRNTLAPISLLPPEILVRVFHSLALDEPPISSEENSGWIRTTHVCRHWRQVALDDSSLWAKISRIGSELDSSLISEMLARARNAPLEIDVYINLIPGLDPVGLFPSHLSHTRVLRLHRVPEYDCEGVREIFNREAPALEHFELEAIRFSDLTTFQDHGGTTLFKGQAPKLQSFCISQVCIPWSFIPRGQLTQLKIILATEMPHEDEDLPSLGNAREFFDLLVNCPALEILVLELCLPRDLSQSSQDRTVHLPHLSRMCVRDSSFGVTNLLKMLRLPSNTTLHLHCVSDYDLSYNDYQILPVVSAWFQSSIPFEFKSLKVSLGHMHNVLRIVASTSFLPSIVRSSRGIEVDMNGEAEFILSFDGFVEVSHWREILEGACKILPISNLEFLSIGAPNTFTSTNWAELFKRCTNVTTIQAVGRGTSGFIRDLTPPNTKKGKQKRCDNSGTSAIPVPGSIMFPNMTSLLSEYLDFNEFKPHSGVLFDILTNGLRRRNTTYNVPIRELHVDHCVISAKQANALKKLVAEFHWDGEEGLMNAFDEFEDLEVYDSDFSGPGAQWEDVFVGSPQDGSELSENYSDEW